MQEQLETLETVLIFERHIMFPMVYRLIDIAFIGDDGNS
jgi:hypothetical protein